MLIHSRMRSRWALTAALVLWLTPALVAPSLAGHPKNWVQRHPTMTGIGAGMATHHALKVSAARKKARGRKLNWAERHPTLTGLGVGTTTRHVIKKHTPQ